MADWSDIAFDVLAHVTSFFPLPDYHIFNAVCKNWRFVAKQKRHSPTPQLPWLVLGEDKQTKKRKFRSLSEDKHYFIDIPELYGRCIRGSSHGWLFAIDIKITCILINPFTRGFFELPPFPYYCSRGDVKLVEVPNDDDDEPYFTYESMQHLILSKGILSHDPKVRSDFIALILFGEKTEVAIWRPGDASWTVIKGPTCALADVTYLNENFYVISFNSTLYVVELGSDPKMIQIDEPRIVPSLISCQNYIVDFKGRLLHIDRFQDLVHIVDILSPMDLSYEY